MPAGSATFLFGLAAALAWGAGDFGGGLLSRRTAVFGVVMNGAAAWMLHRGSSLNERGAYLHLLEDVLGWAAVLLGAVAMYFTGWAVIDPLLSMVISVFIAVNALRTLRAGTGILMQRLPEHFDAEDIRKTLTALPHVRDVHDQHAWSMDGNYVVLTVHLVVDTTDAELLRSVKEQARHALHHQGLRFGGLWPARGCVLRISNNCGDSSSEMTLPSRSPSR